MGGGSGVLREFKAGNPQIQLRRKRDFRPFSLIMLVVAIWGISGGSGREKFTGMSYASALLPKSF